MAIYHKYYLDLYKEAQKTNPRLSYGSFYQSQWFKDYNQAYRFFIFHGNLNVPLDYEFEGIKLGLFVNAMRESKDELFINQIKLLEILNINWEYTEYKSLRLNKFYENEWEKRFELAKVFFEQNNHMKIPKNYKVGEFNLFNWAETQAKVERDCRMPYTRMQKLDSINMIYQTHYLNEIIRISNLPDNVDYLPPVLKQIQILSDRPDYNIPKFVYSYLHSKKGEDLSFFKVKRKKDNTQQLPPQRGSVLFSDMLLELRQMVLEEDSNAEMFENLSKKELTDLKFEIENQVTQNNYQSQAILKIR